MIAQQLSDGEGEALGGTIVADSKLAAPALIMIASSGQPGDVNRLRAAGFSGYLLKPVRQDLLLDALAVALAAQSSDRPIPMITRHSLDEDRIAVEVEAVAVSSNRIIHVLLAEDNEANPRGSRLAAGAPRLPS